jgi:hypothetical protein
VPSIKQEVEQELRRRELIPQPTRLLSHCVILGVPEDKSTSDNE